MELTKIEIEDDFPLMISLCGKLIWKRNRKDEIVVDCLLDRQEDNYSITSISCTELKPSMNKNKIVEVLKYFFHICDEHMSPQCMWGTNECDYESLLINYDIAEKEKFESVFNEITRQFPLLKQPENFLEEIPEEKTLTDMISNIEVAYPSTWMVDYIREN